MTQTSNQLPVLTNATECCADLEGLLSPEFFKALSDPRRQAILLALATSGGAWTVSQVAEVLPINISVVSRHLAQLRNAGILTADRQGKEVHYTVRY
ncbi:MAG: winged helix-turn-helix transcriptional regulator, partial [bacterium]|nr:winged helix-turn-helix transcriptional regulator [bacterium]